MRAKVFHFFIIGVLLLPAISFAACSGAGRYVDDDEQGKAKPWLGVVVKNLPDRALKKRGLENGVEIVRVYEGSPAEKAGLEDDDIITRFDGKEVVDPGDLSKLVKRTKPDDEVKIDYYRFGDKMSTTVTIGARKSRSYVVRNRPGHRAAFLGVKTDNMSEQLRRYFGAPEDQGILIEEVVEDSPAEKAGLQAGDVLLKIGDKKLRKSRDLIRAISDFEPEDEVEVFYLRKKSEQSVTVTLGKSYRPRYWSFRYDDDDGVHIIAPRIIVPDVEIPEMDINVPQIEIEPPELYYFDGGREILLRIREKQNELMEQAEEMRERLNDMREVEIIGI